MRLVTRGDLDGLACAVIVSTFETIDDILLVHPQEITDRITQQVDEATEYAEQAPDPTPDELLRLGAE